MNAIGIDLGGTSAKLAVVDSEGKILQHRKSIWDLREAVDDILGPLIAILKDILSSTQEGGSDVAGIGLSTPGYLNDDRTGIIYAANLQMLNGFPLVKTLEEETGMRVVMDTDVNAGGLAEAVLGAGKDFKRVLFVSIGTGLGGSLIVDRKLVRHTRHGIGHLGHIILQPDGEICGCGNRGCIETLVSAQGIHRIAEKILPHYPTSILHEYSRSGKKIEALDIYLAARDKSDTAAVEILQQEGAWLGLALYNFCAICAPEVIVVGGGLSEAGNFILDKAREVVNERLNPDLYGKVEIKQSHFGVNAGVVGNAVNVMQLVRKNTT